MEKGPSVHHVPDNGRLRRDMGCLYAVWPVPQGQLVIHLYVIIVAPGS